jgi:hypothetical protein
MINNQLIINNNNNNNAAQYLPYGTAAADATFNKTTTDGRRFLLVA